jgi:hypothetical protein
VFEAVSIGIVAFYLVPLDFWPCYQVYGTTVYPSHLLLAGALTALIALVNVFGVGTGPGAVELARQPQAAGSANSPNGVDCRSSWERRTAAGLPSGAAFS